MMREQEDYKLKIRSKYAFNAIASQMQCESDAAKQFIEDCVHEFKLFMSDEESFWSNSLMDRMSEMEEKSAKAKKSAEVRWGKEATPDKGSSEIPSADECEDDANASEIDALKEKKLKVKKLKEKKLKDSSNSGSSGNGPVNSPMNVFGMYEIEIGELTMSVSNKLISLEEDYSEEWLKKAIEVAVFADEKKLRFIEGVLKKWKLLNVTDPWNSAPPAPEPVIPRGENGIRTSNTRKSQKPVIPGIPPSSGSGSLTPEQLENARAMAKKLDDRFNKLERTEAG